jgi:hypothetical protein
MVPHTDSTNCSLHAGDKRQLYGSRRGPSGELFPYLHAQYNESCDFNDEVRWRWATVGPPCRLFASCVRLAVGMAVGVPVCSVLRVWICGGWRNHASWRADTRGVYQYLVCTALSSKVSQGGDALASLDVGPYVRGRGGLRRRHLSPPWSMVTSLDRHRLETWVTTFRTLL